MKKKFNIKQFKGGWTKAPEDKRDYRWEDKIGATVISEEELPDTFCHNLPTYLPYQGSINSCVFCSFAFVESFKQNKELGTNNKFSWRFNYPFTTHTLVGANFRDVAKSYQDIGVSSIYSCPERPEMGQVWCENPDNITEESKLEALDNKIKSYQSVSWMDFRRALYQEPLIIAVGGNNATWNSTVVKDNNYIIDQQGMMDSNCDWFHAIVVVGWKKDIDGKFIYKIANWWGDSWGDKGCAWLKNPYIQAICSVQDLPNQKHMTNVKVVKDKNSTAVGFFVPAVDESAFKSQCLNYGIEVPINPDGSVNWPAVVIEGEVTIS